MESASAPPRSRYALPLLILANLIPLAGCLLAGWEVRLVVLIYWAENLIVGFYTIVRMALLPSPSAREMVRKVFLIPFFTVHYGMFCLAHGLFILLFFYGGTGEDPSRGLPFSPALLVRAWQLSDGLLLWPVIGLLISHGVSLIEHYFLAGERHNLTLNRLMGAPYGRIVVLHVAILAGGILVQSLGSPWPLLVALVVLKTGLDIVLHQRSHSSERSAPAMMEA